MTGADLRQQRERLGLTQSQLAEAFGCARSTILRWERDDMPIEHPGLLWLAFLGLQSRMMPAGRPLPPEAD